MKLKTKRILIGIAFIIAFLMGIITRWYFSESGLIQVKAGSVEGFLVTSILFILLAVILVCIGYLLIKIGNWVKDIKPQKNDDSEKIYYQDLEPISPLLKTFQIIFIGTMSLISLIIIGLVIIAISA